MGRLVGTTTSYSFLTSRTFTNAYAYDKNSNRTSFTDPEGGSTSYAYDTLNRLTTLTPPSAIFSGNFGFSYDALSRRTQMTRPNGVTTDYTYDNLSRLLSVLHKLSGSTIDGATYTVDAVGNRTAKTNHLSGAPAENYTYDSIYQLTQVAQPGPTTTESYTYDAVGNRLSSLAAATWSYNASNHLTSISGSPGTTFTYDNNGNTTSKTDSTGTTTYAWDYENRLTSVTLPSTAVVSFKYDPLGRRIRKVASSATTIYAYDGPNMIEEANSAGTAQARFATGLNVDEPLAQLRAGTTVFYNVDGLGSVTSIIGTGSILQSYIFDSAGNATNSSGSISSPFGYTARELDSETSLYFYRARYFDPARNRFLSEDPIGFSAGVNFYRYVDNNPVVLVDPMGLFPTKWHRAMTYNLAWDIFGPKCAGAAAAVADYNAAEDDVPTTWSKIQFVLGIGSGWSRPGDHFPSHGVLQNRVSKALQSCSLKDLGQALHSVQDWYAHSGPYRTPLIHWINGTHPDTVARNDEVIRSGVTSETAAILRAFKQKCVTCCQ